MAPGRQPDRAPLADQHRSDAAWRYSGYGRFPFSAEQAAAGIRDGWIAQWQLPPLLEALLVFLLLDAWRYWEHRIYHEVPMLWRVHLVHHR